MSLVPGYIWAPLLRRLKNRLGDSSKVTFSGNYILGATTLRLSSARKFDSFDTRSTGDTFP